MKLEGKVDAAMQWAKTWPELDDLIKLNAIRNEDGDAELSPVVSLDKDPYIDGSGRYTFVLMFHMMLPWSDGHDPVNAEAERLMLKWIDWVNQQYPDNVPSWPESNIQDIESLYNVPELTTYEDEEMAEYNFQAQITYIE